MKLKESIAAMHLAHDKFHKESPLNNKVTQGAMISDDMELIALFNTTDGCIDRNNFYEYPGFLLASFSHTSATWMWAWNNDSVSERIKEPKTLKLKYLGEEHGIRELKEPIIRMPVNIFLSNMGLLNSRLPPDMQDKVAEKDIHISIYDEEQLLGLVFQAYKPTAIIKLPAGEGETLDSFFIVTSDKPLQISNKV